MSATRDDDHVITAEVPAKLSAAVHKLGVSLGVKLPAQNEAACAAAQEYYVADLIYKQAEGRRNDARKSLIGMLSIPNAPGLHVVHDSSAAVVTIDNRAQPRRLSEPHIINMICREFKLNVDKAKELIDTCKVASEGYQQHIKAVLK